MVLPFDKRGLFDRLSRKEGSMSLFDLFKRRGSAPVARERLQLLLAYERKNRNQPDLVAVLREEIMAVITRHIQVDPGRCARHHGSRRDDVDAGDRHPHPQRSRDPRGLDHVARRTANLPLLTLIGIEGAGRCRRRAEKRAPLSSARHPEAAGTCHLFPVLTLCVDCFQRSGRGAPAPSGRASPRSDGVCSRPLCRLVGVRSLRRLH